MILSRPTPLEDARRVRGARTRVPRADELGRRVEGSSGPWVVLLPGLGMSAAAWDGVAADLAADHRVVRYDRPGLGDARAERSRPPHLHDEVAHLRRVVQETTGAGAFPTGGRGPGADQQVVLVAHSMSWFIAEAFARSDPGAVAGLVSVDGSAEEHPRARWGIENDARLFLAGALRWVPVVGRRLRTTLLEDAAYIRMASELVRVRRHLPLPLVPTTLLVAARRWVPGSGRWLRRQRHLATVYRTELTRTAAGHAEPATPALSEPATSARVRVVAFRDAGHLVMRDQPQRLAAVVRANGRR